MLGIDLRAAKVTWTVFLIALLIAVVYLTHEAILMFVAAFLLAYVLAPAVKLVNRITPRRVSPVMSLAVVYVCLIVLVGTIATYVGGMALEQAGSLANRVPELIKQNRDLSSVPLPSWAEPMRARLAGAIQEQVNAGAEQVLPLLQRALGGVRSVIGSVAFLILVPILAFFLLKDSDGMRDALLDVVPDRKRALADGILVDLHSMMAHYIRSLLLLSIATSIAYLIFFESIGVPYAVLLALVAAPLEFIPFIGPLLGASIVILIAVFTGFAHVWWLVIFFLCYRMFQDYVLQPYLMSSGVELHPVVVIFGAFAGEQLGGVWGMFLSVPVMATLRLIFLHVRRNRERRDLAA